jgi:glyoxylase-like metal-dependent hydrolase (beta-lactamase superfamily II)
LKQTNNLEKAGRIRRFDLRNLASAWASCSDYFGDGRLKSLAFELRRKIAPSPFKPLPGAWDTNAITAAWLGHSTVLLNFFGLTILTDPILTRSAGIDFLHRTIGARRLIAPALSVRDLPPIDLVLLSHAHMDHLNYATLRRLPGSPQAVTARSTLELLRRTKLSHAAELGWGDKIRISTPHGEVLVEAFEVQH